VLNFVRRACARLALCGALLVLALAPAAGAEAPPSLRSSLMWSNPAVVWPYYQSTAPNGDTVMAGYHPTPATLGTNALSLVGNVGTFVARLDRNDQYVWALGFISTSHVEVAQVVVDAADNTYLAGQFIGELRWSTSGSGTGSVAVTNTNGYFSAFVAKLDRAGAVQWVSAATSDRNVIASGIAVTPAGEIFLTGDYRLNAQFGSQTLWAGPGILSFGYIAKLDGQGNFLWAQNLMERSFGNAGLHVVADGSGAATVVGRYNLSGQVGTNQLSTISGYGSFLARLDGAGNVLWARQRNYPPDQTEADSPPLIAVDPQGGVLGLGQFSGSLQWGTQSVVATTPADIYLAKFDTNGNCLWLSSAGGGIACAMRSLAVDAAGSIYISGSLRGVTQLGPQTVNTHNLPMALLAKADAQGRFLWARTRKISWNTYGGPVSVDAQGGLTWSGQFFDTSAPGPNYEPQGYYGGFLERLNPAPPELTAAPVPGAWQVAWPATTLGYRLEMTDRMRPGAIWQPVSASPQTNADSIQLSLPASASGQFFRLTRP
jgi:hypothetical protein